MACASCARVSRRMPPPRDPFLGTGEAAAEALGGDRSRRPGGRRSARTHGAAAPASLAGSDGHAIQAGTMASVRQVLKDSYRERVGGGYVDVEVVGTGNGQAYEPAGTASRRAFRGGPYSASGRRPRSSAAPSPSTTPERVLRRARGPAGG